MPKFTGLTIAIAAMLIVFTSAPVLAQSKPANKKLYCWEQGGQRVCSDTPPNQALSFAHDEVSVRSGRTTASVARTLNDEERAALQANAAQQRADAAAAETRSRTEQAMLQSYDSESDLLRVFNDRTETLDNSVQTTSYNLLNLRTILSGFLSTASTHELNGQTVPAQLANDIQNKYQEIQAQQRLLIDFRQQRSAMDGEVADTLRRYRVIKSASIAASRGS